MMPKKSVATQVVTVRVPTIIHAFLKQEAKEKGISLNAMCIERMSKDVPPEELRKVAPPAPPVIVEKIVYKDPPPVESRMPNNDDIKNAKRIYEILDEFVDSHKRVEAKARMALVLKKIIPTSTIS